MSLKTLVKVGNISNLSDARYCAGMGVDMLGFQVIEGKDNFISPKTYQEIRGWVSGPAVVVELYGISNAENLQHIIENFAPDFLEVALADLPFIVGTTLPIILSLDEEIILRNGRALEPVKERIAFVAIRESENSIEFIQKISSQFSTLIRIESPSDIPAILEKSIAKGIILNGSKEIKPGLKDYDHLAEVLEQLEVD